MSISDKLRLFMALVYGSNYTSLAKALGTSTASVSRWAKGGEISGKYLTQLYGLGLDLNWLADDNESDSTKMFANNATGQELRTRHFAAQGKSTKKVLVVKQTRKSTG